MSRIVEQCVLVCVTGQRQCERLIAKGKNISERDLLSLQVLHIALPEENLQADRAAAADALNYLYGQAHESGAEMTILYAKDAKKAIIDFAEKNNAKIIVVGSADGKTRFADQLEMQLPHTQIICMQ